MSPNRLLDRPTITEVIEADICNWLIEHSGVSGDATNVCEYAVTAGAIVAEHVLDIVFEVAYRAELAGRRALRLAVTPLLLAKVVGL